ncbi:ABC-type multidrug transport system permease subunit [Dysgonomonas sp. PFB1-18]|jgi:hypothetical protein|uniref:hypothetical protein n=1 Tax=unclassified Dysgonomonas TaxID=2630389 RepID=UPI00247366CA|nr:MULTISPECIES: hypothetical protein [unclassified Dysgonomonas]MDH6308428.1 ABC-type multidrug transport system permease subunit [Dysgonomonas sp. PF1-14]MDH6337929.1 ABC-type multidrug transport system permease subunit [Dysgonomonas sp. PF1-16]MDH6379426.1 ABC-type multidrug transport system permease subunit [Dysgonomonas sp. PFB1-18]MDH6396757.1 ABC-type multidrug transport system permease subunit [Dysgonomonas sp. PF1-23]
MSNNSEDKNLNTALGDIKLELLSYINRRIRFFRLDAYEKLSISASILGYGLIVFCIVAVMLFFILLGIAFFIGELLDSQAAGFGVMALFSLLVLLIVFLLRKKIKKSLLNKTIMFIRKVEANEE